MKIRFALLTLFILGLVALPAAADKPDTNMNYSTTFMTRGNECDGFVDSASIETQMQLHVLMKTTTYKNGTESYMYRQNLKLTWPSGTVARVFKITNSRDTNWLESERYTEFAVFSGVTKCADGRQFETRYTCREEFVDGVLVSGTCE